MNKIVLLLFSNISWSAHFAASQDSYPRPPAISGLMSLFRENAHSLAMVKHGMYVTEYVHPGLSPSTDR